VAEACAVWRKKAALRTLFERTQRCLIARRQGLLAFLTWTFRRWKDNAHARRENE
jgi:hypothetical protein